MQPICDTADEDRLAHTWLRLRADLVRWLRARCEKNLDIENIASDTMVFAMDGCEYCPVVDPRSVWRWMCGTASHRVNDLRRARRAHPVDLRPSLDETPAGEPQLPSRAASLLAFLRRVVRGASLDILELMANGETNNVAMAQHLGVGVRAVERTRQRLRELSRALLTTPDSCSVPYDYLHG